MSSSDAASHLNLWFAQGSHHAHHAQQGNTAQQQLPQQQLQQQQQQQQLPQGQQGQQPTPLQAQQQHQQQPDNSQHGASPYVDLHSSHAQLQYSQHPQHPSQMHHHQQQQQQQQQPQYDYAISQFPVDPHQQYHPYAHHQHQPQHGYPDMQHYQQMDPSLHYAGAEALFQQQGGAHDPSLQGGVVGSVVDEAPAPVKPKKGKKKAAKRTDPYGDGAEPVVVNNDGSIPLSRAAFKTVCKYCCMKKDENPQYQMGVFHKGKCTNPLDPEHGSRWLSLRCKSCSKDVCTSSEIYKRHQCPPGYPSPMPGKSYRTHRRKKEDEGDIDDIDQYWTEPGLSSNLAAAGGGASGIGGGGVDDFNGGNVVVGDPSSAYHNSLDVLSQLAGAH
ncbi:hypothetical protein HDU98_011530 [Podochytrium sp. JEL0797]|nr:hypothetical protein HDU98_011530 [Podochytrium sp. JEL0797]